jgi:transglutaminase-like putative cysteine protease
MILNLIFGLLLNQTDDVKKPVVTRWSFENVETVLFEGELSFRASGQNMDVKEWGIFTCKAPELPTQKNVQTKVQVLNAKTAPVPVRDFSPLMRTVYLTRLPVKEAINKDLIDVKVSYQAELIARKLVPATADMPVVKVEPLKEQEKNLYLMEWGDVKFKDKEFQAWMENNKLIRQAGERDLDFARKVFRQINYKLDFDLAENMDRKSTAVSIMMKSDAGGISNLFVAILRANKVPARSLWGRMVMTAAEMEKQKIKGSNQMSVRCEFFAEDIGWVPADPGSALYSKKNKIDPDTCFGIDYAAFFSQHVDPNIDVHNPLSNKRINIIALQTPAYWIYTQATTLGTVKVTQDWKVTKREKKTEPVK